MIADGPVAVLISADPRTSHRAAEALRIGLGVVAGEHEVLYVLRGPGVHLLDADTDALVEGDDVAKFRDALRRLGVPFHVLAGDQPADADWNADGHPVRALDLAEAAALVAGARRSLVF